MTHEEYKKIKQGKDEIKDMIIREGSDKRLRSVMEQKIRTTMIGAINAAEVAFGELFGFENGKQVYSDEELSSMEKQWKERFQDFRTKVLELGNRQMSNMHAEVNCYDVKFKGYHIDFQVKG